MENLRHFIVLISIWISFAGCGQNQLNDKTDRMNEIATFGAGCFWCVEAIFQSLNGVDKVVSGYSGGHVKNPGYKEVCKGLTGHAEVVQISFDPSIISFKELLEVFFQTHDPTTLNRQGNDVGTQYRSSIFYHSEEQRILSEQVVENLTKEGVYDNEIVTEIEVFDSFYEAENYHQDYYEINGDQPYCQFVVKPKVEKFKKAFGDKLK